MIRVGIIGNGYATQTFHAPLVRATPGLELAAVCHRDGVDELLARADIDLVVIPTPNHTHHPLAARALAAGKHVVVDKPFTVTRAEAQDLIARAAHAGRVLSVFHNRRWDNDFLALRELVAQGTLGRVTQVASHFDRFRPVVRDRWRESDIPGGGLWYDLGPHLLDQALQLWGQPQALWVDLQRQRDGALTDDGFHALLRYADGLRVHLHATMLAAEPAPRWRVHGTRGSWVHTGLDPQEDALKAGVVPGEAGWPLAPSAGDYRSYYAALRDAIAHGAPNPVPPDQALAVIGLIEQGAALAQASAG